MDTTAEIIEYYREALQNIYDAEEATNIALLAIETVSGKDRKYLLSNKRTHLTLTAQSLLRLADFVPQLQQNTPIQYVLGHAWFYGLELKVNENVLIPRQETEELVDWIIKDHKQTTELNILDIGTGSGCIPITLAKKMPGSIIYSVDISEPAIETAKINAELNTVNISFVKADILTESGQKLVTGIMKNKVDIIVSNPPYVRNSEKKQMHGNVLDFEPHLALFVDDTDALLFYKAIADFARFNLQKGGKLYFEINENKGQEMTLMLADKGFTDIVLKQDLNGRDRMMRCEFK